MEQWQSIALEANDDLSLELVPWRWTGICLGPSCSGSSVSASLVQLSWASNKSSETTRHPENQRIRRTESVMYALHYAGLSVWRLVREDPAYSGIQAYSLQVFMDREHLWPSASTQNMAFNAALVMASVHLAEHGYCLRSRLRLAGRGPCLI